MFMSKLNKNYGETSEQSFYLLMEEISLESCQGVIQWILEMNISAETKPKMLNLFICSPGGSIDAAFATIDIMRGSAIPIRTIGIGEISSAGLAIFLAGAKGHRVLTPNTSILSHQYSWGSQGKHHELMSTVKQFELTHRKLIDHYRKFTGLSEEIVVEKLLPAHDSWLTAQEALEFGICDSVKELK